MSAKYNRPVLVRAALKADRKEKLQENEFWGRDETVADAIRAGYIDVEGEMDIVHLLLDAGADAIHGLVYAAEYGDEAERREMVRVLLDAGPDLREEEYKYGWSIMGTAAKSVDKEVVRWFLDAGGDPFDGVQGALYGKHSETLQMLLDLGLSKTRAERERLGWDIDKALAGVAYVGNIDLTRRLLDHGADPDMGLLWDVDERDPVEGIYDYDPHSGAIDGGHPHIVQLMLDCGATIHLKDSVDRHRCENILQRAIRNICWDERDDMESLYEIVGILLSAGAAVHLCSSCRGKRGTALHWALGDDRVFPSVIAHVGRMDNKQEILDVALQLAAKTGYCDDVKLLLDAGADPRAEDHMALKKAADEGKTKVVEMLIEGGADRRVLADYVPESSSSRLKRRMDEAERELHELLGK
ncbi:hypothetical protein HDV00_008168 [Rhizophlyctis rosea]|nr:hypothetical protein HDV00_008168 [Rhizophlyctis rosea]